MDGWIACVINLTQVMTESDPAFAVGERFLCWLILDNAALTDKDKALIMSRSNHTMTAAALFPASRSLGPLLTGQVPVGPGFRLPLGL